MTAHGQAASVASSVSGVKIMEHLNNLVNIGEHRRSGTDEGERAFKYIAGQLKAAGLQPQIEKYPFRFFQVKKAGLQNKGKTIDAFPLYYSGKTPSRGIISEVVFVESAKPEDFQKVNIRGKIVLAALKNGLGNKPDNLANAYKTAAVNGAIGMIIYLEDWLEDSLLAFNSEEYPWEMKMPSVFITRRSGHALRDEAAKGKLSLTLTLDAKIKNMEVKNIFAILKGQSEDIAIINAPYNSWFKSTVERAGTAGAIHLAEVYAGLPPNQRSKTLVFSFTSGHEHGFLGVKNFLKRHEKDILPAAKIFMNLGAGLAGKKFVIENGRLVETNSAEGRAAICSENDSVIESVKKSLAAEKIKYQLFTNLRIGEAREAHAYGIPNFALFSLNNYFHSPLDTIEKTNAALVEPAVRVYANILD